MEQKYFRKGGGRKSFLGMLLLVTFFLNMAAPVFCAESIADLVRQGDEALGRGDYEQALALSHRVIAQEPYNLNGYYFALVYCLVNRQKPAFDLIVQDARRRIGPGPLQVMLTEMVARILYAGQHTVSAYEGLCEYEAQWRRMYDRPR